MAWLHRFQQLLSRGKDSSTKPEIHRLGEWGETRAAAYLKKKGFKLLGRNIRIDRDEIDLLMRQGEQMIFVEVKTRKSETFGRPSNAVGAAKRKKLQRAAKGYLRKINPKPTYIRFDVVEVIGQPDAADPPEIRHLENVFNAGTSWDARW